MEERKGVEATLEAQRNLQTSRPVSPSMTSDSESSGSASIDYGPGDSTTAPSPAASTNNVSRSHSGPSDVSKHTEQTSAEATPGPMSKRDALLQGILERQRTLHGEYGRCVGVLLCCVDVLLTCVDVLLTCVDVLLTCVDVLLTCVLATELTARVEEVREQNISLHKEKQTLGLYLRNLKAKPA